MTSHPIGTGPFKVAHRRQARLRSSGTRRTGARAPRATPLPYLDKITFVALPDSTARLGALRSGDVDIFQTADTQNLVQAKKDPTWWCSPSPVAARPSSCSTRTSRRSTTSGCARRSTTPSTVRPSTRATTATPAQPAYGPLEPSNPYYDPEGPAARSTTSPRPRRSSPQVKADGKSTTVTALCISTHRGRRAEFAIINQGASRPQACPPP